MRLPWRGALPTVASGPAALLTWRAAPGAPHTLLASLHYWLVPPLASHAPVLGRCPLATTLHTACSGRGCARRTLSPWVCSRLTQDHSGAASTTAGPRRPRSVALRLGCVSAHHWRAVPCPLWTCQRLVASCLRCAHCRSSAPRRPSPAPGDPPARLPLHRLIVPSALATPASLLRHAAGSGPAVALRALWSASVACLLPLRPLPLPCTRAGVALGMTRRGPSGGASLRRPRGPQLPCAALPWRALHPAPPLACIYDDTRHTRPLATPYTTLPERSGPRCPATHAILCGSTAINRRTMERFHPHSTHQPLTALIQHGQQSPSLAARLGDPASDRRPTRSAPLWQDKGQ